ncbi:hypothetical protein BHM03_00048445 [Ensete ventricosum]|nr:hypothetical protein BHM03_00048445 [Ensete ventricosum]
MVFMRKIDFKLRVMRLNCVKLFYVLVAAIGSESRRCLSGRGSHMHVVCMQSWLAKARTPAGQPTMAWLPVRDSRPWPSPLQGAATRGHGQLRPALLPAGAAPLVEGVAAPWQGGCRSQRATRHSGSVEVTARPTMPWREITTHGDARSDNDEINNHRTWRCANAHIDPIMSD